MFKLRSTKIFKTKVLTTCFLKKQKEVWNQFPYLNFCTRLEEKYFSHCIPLTDQISVADCFYLLEILSNRCIEMFCFPVYDVINFKIKLSFVIKPFSFSTRPKSQDKNENILRTRRQKQPPEMFCKKRCS